MPEQKKFDLSPSISILIAGVTIAGAILLTHYFPASPSAAVENNGQGAPTIQQQMSPALYLELAKALGADEAAYNSCVNSSKYQAKIDADSAEAQRAGGQGTPFTLVLNTETNKVIPVSGALPYEQLKSAIANAETGGTASTVRPPSATEHIIGSPTAPIVLIEYSDFQCPYCRLIHPSLKRIVSESNGEVAWVYRHFPLNAIHPEANPSANAVECIVEQLGNEGFWQFANTIFEG